MTTREKLVQAGKDIENLRNLIAARGVSHSRNYAELAEYRAAVAEWARRCEWGADCWKREPYNAALFALAKREAERKQVKP